MNIPVKETGKVLRHWRGIRGRMILWFGLIFILGLSGIQTIAVYGLPWFGLVGKVEAERRQAYLSLSIIADVKKEQVLDRFKWLTKEMQFIVSLPSLRGAVEQLLTKSGGQSGEKILMQGFLTGLSQQLGVVRRVNLLEPEMGKDVLSPEHSRGYGELHPFQITRMTEKAYVSEVMLLEGDVPIFYITQPIQGKDERMVAILLVEVVLEKFLQPLLHTGATLGGSGEILLVNSQNRQLSSPLHPLPDGQRAVPMVYVNRGKPANLASRGMEGVVEATDYRGILVLAAYRHVRINSQWGWGLVVKMDESEIYQDLHLELRDWVWLLTFYILVTSGLIFLLAGRISAPLLYVSRVAGEFAAGNLEVRTAVQREDEIGILAYSFDAMADHIAAMITQVQSRGKELELANTILASQKRTQEKIVTVTATLATAESMELLLREGVSALLRATDCHAAALYLVLPNEQQDCLVLQVAMGWQEEQVEQKVVLGQGMVGLAALRRDMEIICNLPEPLVLSSLVAGELPVRHLLLVPLRLHNRLVGVLELGSLQEMDSTVAEILEVCRHQFATAIVNAIAHGEVSRMAEDLTHKNSSLELVNRELHQQSHVLQEQRVELELQQQQLKEANRLKSEFLSHMSHELRTPLHSILALSQLMVQKGIGNDLPLENSYLAIIERNGRNLLGLINDILDLSRIEAGAMGIKIQSFQPQALLQRCFDTMRPLAEAKNLTLVMQGGTDLWMKSDEGKVERILLNFLSNAVKFTQYGQIVVAAVFQGRQVHFSVQDSGIGIAPQMLNRIFDPFTQVGGDEKQQKLGSGLGLTICRKMANLLGGEIEVTSVLGEGAVFHLVLPDGMDDASIPQGEPFREQVILLGKKALLVDDQNWALMQLSDVLVEEGCEVTAVTSAGEALSILEEGWVPDVAVLDLIMPGISGFELLEKIRSFANTTALPVVILTAKALTQEEWGRLECNHVQELVTKGMVNRQELVRKIRVAMGAMRGNPSGKGVL